MNVLLITVRSDYGGGPRHVDQLVNHLRQDIDLYLAYPKDGIPYSPEWDNNTRIKGRYYIPYRSFSFKTLLGLKQYVKENGIAVIHSHGNGAGVYSRLLKLFCPKVKVVHTFHGITENYDNKMKKLANIACGKFMKRLTDTFILVSQGEKLLGEKLGFVEKGHSFVINNGVLPPPNSYISKQETVTHNVDGHRIFTIVTFSRFDYQKNMDMAFDIAERFKEIKDVVFYWVGDGDDYGRLKNKAEALGINIVFTGFSKEPQRYLEVSDIYLSTSRFEGLPYALIEAQSYGIPVVATNVVGNNEVVENGVNGFLFASVEDAVEKITLLKNEVSIRQKMSEAAKESYLQNFTIEKMVNKIEAIYDALE